MVTHPADGIDVLFNLCAEQADIVDLTLGDLAPIHSAIASTPGEDFTAHASCRIG